MIALSIAIALPTLLLFLVLKDDIAINFPVRESKGNNYCFRNSWKSNSCIGSNTEKKICTNIKKKQFLKFVKVKDFI